MKILFRSFEVNLLMEYLIVRARLSDVLFYVENTLKAPAHAAHIKVYESKACLTVTLIRAPSVCFDISESIN